jgi:hypothetical protein
MDRVSDESEFESASSFRTHTDSSDVSVENSPDPKTALLKRARRMGLKEADLGPIEDLVEEGKDRE